MSSATGLQHEHEKREGHPLTLPEIIEEVAHLLPEQAPLHAFVHHNTLHAFEHLPFEEAVVVAGERLDAEPFPSEELFRESLDSGRILARDVAAVVAEASGPADERSLFLGGVSRRELRTTRLGHLFEIPRESALDWHLAETDATTRFHPRVSAGRRERILQRAREVHGDDRPRRLERRALRSLWGRLALAAPLRAQPARCRTRPRDRILAETGIDTDEWTHPFLIRLAAAYLDQGIAYWPMPGREGSFLEAFRTLYGVRNGPPNPWLRGLGREVRRQRREDWSAERTIEWALVDLEVAAKDRARVIERTLLSLRGWAGMMRHFETRPDRAPVEARSARLIDYLAVQLVFDVHAARHARRLSAHRRPVAASSGEPGPTRSLEPVYEAYVLAQLCAVDLEAFAQPENARKWIEEVLAFDATRRRALLHLAYERRHRIEVLDGVAAHARLEWTEPPRPGFQAVFCIDDREESTRRHLEECCPAVETFGYAGFFAVAMSYQGLEDIRPRPLCPVVIHPEHLVVEEPIDLAAKERYERLRRRQGFVTNLFSVGTRTLARGSMLTAGIGLLAVIPLIARCLFPRWTERISHRMRHGKIHEPTTRLAIERTEDERDRAGLLRGYSIEEMARLVEAALRTMALDRNLCRIVLFVGHGSSSLNNPHEAAHDCGATGGGRGGPNARAFAAMANHPGVRKLLAERELEIPASTWFVGSYHNTCDDSMEYYDRDLIPASHLTDFAGVESALEEACRRDAHERCRRFDSAPDSLEIEDALAHAESHAVDLAQPRPEYGHATNAVCIVGRRARTRGLFLDRRAFLVSYDPTRDSEGALLTKLLLAVGPVGAGINLEYYFSFVDPIRYGSGTKLPHNITGLFGVMDGHASDLRTGLPWQMVEIHEPVRLLTIVEAEPERLEKILDANPSLGALVQRRWIQLVAWSPDSDRMHVYQDGGFRPHQNESETFPIFASSGQYYSGRTEHLRCASIGPHPHAPGGSSRSERREESAALPGDQKGDSSC